MKKTLAFFTILLMTVSLLAGCTPEEMTFLQLNQEIGTLDTYTMTGSINWDTDLEMLLGDSEDIGIEKLASQKDFIRMIDAEGLKHITFSYAVDMKNSAVEASYSAGNAPLFSLILVKDTYYVNFDGLLDLVKRNDTQALQEDPVFKKLEALKGKYLAVTTQELLSDGFLATEGMQPPLMQNSLAKQQAFNKNIQNAFIDFAKTELSEHNPGLVKKTYDSSLKADVFGYSVKLEEMPLITLEFMMVLLDHLDSTEALVTRIISDPVIQEQAGMDKDTMLTEVKSGFDKVRGSLSETKLQLSAVIAQEKTTREFGTQIQSLIGSATLESSIAKLAPKKYWSQMKMTLENTSSKIPFKRASLDATVTLDAGQSPVIGVPASVIPFNTFNETLPHILILEPDTNSATYEAGLLPTKHLKVDMKNIGGYWFISTGSLPKQYQALVKQEGAAVSIGGTALSAPASLHRAGDVTYISVSSLRNAGMDISWNSEYRTLTVKN